MTKQIEIELPEGYTFKEVKDGKIICEEEVKKLTYEDVAKELFYGKSIFFTSIRGNINGSPDNLDEEPYCDPNNATSERQLEKLLDINKLMNVAKYLNGDWKPNWNDEEEGKYYITLEHVNNDLFIDVVGQFQSSDVYFKSKELAKQAIEILGEKIVKLALCTDY